MFSFAHAALRIGAYAAVLLAGEMGIHPIIAVLLGGVVAGILQHPGLRSRCFACQGHTSEWSHWRSRRSSTGW